MSNTYTLKFHTTEGTIVTATGLDEDSTVGIRENINRANKWLKLDSPGEPFLVNLDNITHIEIVKE